MIIFYDFEVFKFDWLVVFINPTTQEKTVIINDYDKIEEFYNAHKEFIFVGYNSRNYDSYIFKSALLKFNLKNINDYIILENVKGWQIDKRYKFIRLYDYDTSKPMQGLKQLEAFIGSDIEESKIPFDINRRLTQEEIIETEKYCTHDVEQTIEVFLKSIDDFNAHMDLIKTFNLNISSISKTKAQLTAEILKCRKVNRNDEFNLMFVDTLRLDKYKFVLEWFKDENNRDYSKSLTAEIAGVPHVFAWGGLHGCPSKPLHKKGAMIHIDVTSYYPSIMIRYDFLSRNCEDKNKFTEIYKKRIELKKAGKKKEQAPYKIILNSTYGICKDKYSQAYDPLMANNVCINGQLLLLDLIEKLENYCTIIQSNTDGLIIEIENNDEAYNKIDDICYEWETRTGMQLAFDNVSEIWQGDVNNYIVKFENGEIERKGAYIKELTALDNDLPIVNRAIVNYLVDGVPVEDTILNCDDMIDFQKVYKISGKYKYAWHNGKKLNGKTFRVFASVDESDSWLGKQKEENATIEKFANCPEHCFIDNSEIKNKKCVSKINKKWYISLAYKRISEKFDVDLENKTQEIY